jgi:predicted MFS family arabinose efflux permease
MREFRALFAAQCLTVAAASVGSLALGTTIYASTRSPVLSALAMFGGPLIRLAATWFLASASDLLRPRQALTVMAVVTVAADGLQAVPDLAWGFRFALLALPWIVMSATGGSMIALVSDIVPRESFVLARSTMNIAVGVTQIAGYGLGGLLLLSLRTGQLFVCAAGTGAVALLIVRFGVGDHPPRAAGPAIRRSHTVNRHLLRSPVLRPVLLALWMPNGLVVGCEAMFVPFAGHHAGYLFSATAGGMLLGDVLVGRFVDQRIRDRLIEPLYILLAAPYLAFLIDPAVVTAAAAGFVASIGYSASLPLQERLVTHTEQAARGQVLGLNTAGMMAMQGVGAALAGTLAQALGATAHSAATAAGIMAAMSLAVTASLAPGLSRSRPDRQVPPVPSVTTPDGSGAPHVPGTTQARWRLPSARLGRMR